MDTKNQTPQTTQPQLQASTPLLNAKNCISYGPEPQNCKCPQCLVDIKTTVKPEATTKTHLMAGLLCVFLCWPCVCVPYCIDSCQNKNHYCPNCNAYLGTYNS